MRGRAEGRRRLWCLVTVGLSVASPSALAERAPVSLFGHLGYEYRFDRFDDAERMEHSGILSLGAASYLWQPWFAQVDGILNLRLRESERELSRSASDGLGLDGGQAAGDRTGTFTSGIARLRLFPLSRFPFEAYFERRRDEIEDRFFDTETTLTRYGLIQSYTGEDGLSYRARYEHRVRGFEQEGAGRDETDVVDLLQLGAGRRFGRLNLDFDATYSESEERGDGDDTSTLFAALRHRYTPLDSLAIDGQVAFQKLGLDRDSDELVSRRFEWSEFALWRPPMERPLWVSGAMRFVESEIDLSGTDLEQRSIAGSLGVRHEPTEHWTLSGDLTARTTTDDEDTHVDTLQRVGARYRSDGIALGPVDHEWFVSLELGNERVENGGTRDTRFVETRLGQQLEHVVSGSWYPLRLRLYQELSATEDSDGRSTQTVHHDAIASWSRSTSHSSTFVGLTLSDSRSFGGGGFFGDENDEYQIVNLQLSRSDQLGRDMSFGGSVNAQAYRKAGFVENAADDGEFEPSLSVDLTYRFQRLFGVPRLHFRSVLRYFSSSYRTLLDDVDDTVENEGRVWDNRLQYTIGKLAFLLIGRMSEIREREHALVLFQVRRHFDTYY